MVKIAQYISLAGAAVFSFIWITEIGRLRDKGAGWADAVFHKNKMFMFGAIGVVTILALSLT